MNIIWSDIKLLNVFARFEFVRGIGTDILPIRLQQNQDLTGKVLKHITANGPIYVRTLVDIQQPEKVAISDIRDLISNSLHVHRSVHTV